MIITIDTQDCTEKEKYELIKYLEENGLDWKTKQKCISIMQVGREQD